MTAWVTTMDVLGVLLTSLAWGAFAHVCGAPLDLSLVIGAGAGAVLHMLLWRRMMRDQRKTPKKTR